MEGNIMIIPHLDESPGVRTLRYYHHLLDNLEEPKDSEDKYQDYIWKVDKITSTKRRGRDIYLQVIWKSGGHSWISLKSLRLHDPYSCVMYAISKKLIHHPEWSWTTDFIDDTDEYSKLIHALKTSKQMGPKYQFGVEIPRSVRHALEIDKEMVIIYGEMLS